jgi:hypothetical protein
VSWPTRCRGFETIKFLRCFHVNHMPNLQNGNPGYLSFSGTSLYICLPLVALPADRLPTTQFCSLYTIQLQVSNMSQAETHCKLRYLENGNINKQDSRCV